MAEGRALAQARDLKIGRAEEDAVAVGVWLLNTRHTTPLSSRADLLRAAPLRSVQAKKMWLNIRGNSGLENLQRLDLKIRLNSAIIHVK